MSTIDYVALWRGIFSIFLVATIMTIGEILVFFNVVVPDIRRQVHYGATRNSKCMLPKFEAWYEIHWVQFVQEKLDELVTRLDLMEAEKQLVKLIDQTFVALEDQLNQRVKPWAKAHLLSMFNANQESWSQHLRVVVAGVERELDKYAASQINGLVVSAQEQEALMEIANDHIAQSEEELRSAQQEARQRLEAERQQVFAQQWVGIKESQQRPIDDTTLEELEPRFRQDFSVSSPSAPAIHLVQRQVRGTQDDGLLYQDEDIICERRDGVDYCWTWDSYTNHGETGSNRTFEDSHDLLPSSAASAVTPQASQPGAVPMYIQEHQNSLSQKQRDYIWRLYHNMKVHAANRLSVYARERVNWDQTFERGWTTMMFALKAEVRRIMRSRPSLTVYEPIREDMINAYYDAAARIISLMNAGKVIVLQDFLKYADLTISTNAVREANLTAKINEYTKLTSFGIIMVLVIGLLMIYGKIRKNMPVKSALPWRVISGSTLATSLLTVLSLIIFQALFFVFGRRYKYPGTVGQEEMQLLVLDNILL